MDDTMESLDDDELEEEADEEVDKVLYQLTDGKLGQAGQVGTELPTTATKEAEEDIPEEEMQRMQKQLQELLAG